MRLCLPEVLSSSSAAYLLPDMLLDLAKGPLPAMLYVLHGGPLSRRSAGRLPVRLPGQPAEPTAKTRPDRPNYRPPWLRPGYAAGQQAQRLSFLGPAVRSEVERERISR
jgi:hypothetical protein